MERFIIESGVQYKDKMFIYLCFQHSDSLLANCNLQSLIQLAPAGANDSVPYDAQSYIFYYLFFYLFYSEYLSKDPSLTRFDWIQAYRFFLHAANGSQ